LYENTLLGKFIVLEKYVETAIFGKVFILKRHCLKSSLKIKYLKNSYFQIALFDKSHIWESTFKKPMFSRMGNDEGSQHAGTHCAHCRVCRAMKQVYVTQLYQSNVQSVQW
jgi:hypothetical protein